MDQWEGAAVVMAFMALAAALASLVVSLRGATTGRHPAPDARLPSLASISPPRPRFEIVIEAYDTREFARGRLLWYWAVSVSNVGGSAFSVDRLVPDTGDLPMAVLARKFHLQNVHAPVSVYLFDRPVFQEIFQHSTEIDKYPPKSFEELGTINQHVAEGETKTLYIALLVTISDRDVDSVLLNAKLSTNTGDSFKLGRFVAIGQGKT